MAMSKFVSDNKEYLRNAINDGVSGDAITSTLVDVVNNIEKLDKTPTQLKKSIEVIAGMKSNVKGVNSEDYSSKLIKENSKKIKIALRDGISPKEIAISLTRTLNDNNKEYLSFTVKLISKMKSKEITLSKKGVKEKQKINKIVRD